MVDASVLFASSTQKALLYAALKKIKQKLKLIGADNRRAVAQPCVNGDRLSKGKMAKFDPTQIRNPSTDRHKI